MARPNKQGLDYFPLDVGIFENDKMLAISGEFSVKGEIIMLRLLCEIYRNGYFVEFSELLKNKLARLGGLSGGLVEEVVRKLVKYEFFDGFVFSEHNILTSKNIQRVYLEASKRRKEVDFSQYWLLKEVNVYINPASDNINDNINEQSKGKESKVNISFLEKKKQKSASVDFDEEEKNNQPLSDQKETSPRVAAAPPPFNFRQAMLSAGFAADLTEDWLKIRKAKKAINSERAFKVFLEQIQRTGQDKNTILALVVQKQWKGFEASWIQSAQQSHNPQEPITIDQNGNIISGTHTTNTAGANVVGRQTAANIAANMQGW